MKTQLFYDRLLERWVPAPIDTLLIDKPLPDLSYFSAFDNNLLETPDGYRLEVAVPGMRKKDLKLDVSGRVLTVQGQKRQQDVFGWFGEGVRLKRTQLCRTIILPKDADANRIKARCRDGLLVIKVPKVNNRDEKRYIPVELAEEQESWGQSFVNSVKMLKSKLNIIMNKLGFGSGPRKIILS
ncbi:Hsp20/alpha crystallin family protein [Pontibacter sp. 13R65]|uniref:Hsp20/alpha crystallin family protein n=1 Tax=Pontibacter sp. 13R65 TaxID=3127458 RepID=UPI00301DF039